MDRKVINQRINIKHIPRL